MAVDFYRNVQVLIQDFQRRGLHPQVVATSGGEPPRAVQIRVADELMVHWDADSRSVWAEGPWPDVERLEAYIRRRFSGGMRRKLRKPRVLARVVGLCIILALIFGVCVPLLRKRPLVVSPTSSLTEPVKLPAGSPAASSAESNRDHSGSASAQTNDSSEASTEDAAQPPSGEKSAAHAR